MKILFAVIVLSLCAPIFAQTHDSIFLDDPAYLILENAQARGALPLLSNAKPYSRSYILQKLEVAIRAEGLSDLERKLIQSHIDRLTTKGAKAQTGHLAAETPLGHFDATIHPVVSFRMNAANPSNWQTIDGLIGNFAGDIGEFSTFRLTTGVTVDRIAPDFFYQSTVTNGNYNIRSPGAYAPYQFVKEYDGIHYGLSGDNDDGFEKFRIGFHQSSEITVQLFEDLLTIRFARMQREWGPGDGSLTLSSTAAPLDGLEFQIAPASWFNYSYLIASTGDWFNDMLINRGSGTVPDATKYPSNGTQEKMFALQRLEIEPWEWLQVNFIGAVVFAKRFELDYLNPLMIGFVTQNLHGDFDNTALNFEVVARLPVVGKLYADLFVDEITLKPLSDVRNIFAWQFGLETAVPFLPLTTVTLQYTKLEPFVYTHYVQPNNPGYYQGVNEAFTNAGMNIGYYLPPNSDEILVRIKTAPTPELNGSLTYKLIRHGTNSTDSNGRIDGVMYGNIDIPMNYASYPYGGYPNPKAFLYDGIYDWTNMVSIQGNYKIPDFPLQIGFEYTFAYTFWTDYANSAAPAVTLPAPITTHIFAIKLSFF